MTGDKVLRDLLITLSFYPDLQYALYAHELRVWINNGRLVDQHGLYWTINYDLKNQQVSLMDPYGVVSMTDPILFGRDFAISYVYFKKMSDP